MLDKAQSLNDLRVPPANRIDSRQGKMIETGGAFDWCSPRPINEIVPGKRGIAADLAMVFGTSVRFRMGLQAEYGFSRAPR
jgi:hypothetical protein